MFNNVSYNSLHPSKPCERQLHRVYRKKHTSPLSIHALPDCVHFQRTIKPSQQSPALQPSSHSCHSDSSASPASQVCTLKFNQHSTPHGRSNGESILSKSSRQRLLAADLLPTNERVHRHCNGAVDVLRSAVFRKTHLAECLADTHDGF